MIFLELTRLLELGSRLGNQNMSMLGAYESEASREVMDVVSVLFVNREVLVSEANRDSKDCWSPEVRESEVSRESED